MKSPSPVSADKDPDRLSRVDALAHAAFASLEARLGRVPSALIDEAVEILPADTAWPDLFAAEAARLRPALPPVLLPAIEHIGSTSVPGLDAKPIIDIMPGIARPERIEELVPILEGLGYESLGTAGVPGRWSLRRRTADGSFNISLSHMTAGAG
jgi:GrpB-like predicted nucleotidyltransferase (UPF0157 family)